MKTKDKIFGRINHCHICNSKKLQNIIKLGSTGLCDSLLTKKQIIQCRAFLQAPLNPKLIGSKHDTPHTDLSYSHTVYLYYVIDSDGDTLFLKNSKIVKKITPKKGRLVIFNGDIQHTAEQPKKGVRCVINFDVIKDV